MDLAAFPALVQDHVALFGIGLNADGLHLSAAGVGAVSRIDVHVEGPETEGAVVSGRVSKRLYLPSAMGANKAVVVFCKAFLFHVMLLQKVLLFIEIDLLYYSIKAYSCQEKGVWNAEYSKPPSFA